MKIFYSVISGIVLLFMSCLVNAQFEVGHLSSSFYDDSRDRDIPVEIYYPAESTGDNVPFASGAFPTIVFGHGFFMPWSDYSNIWNFMVPEGYVMVFATTEGDISPSHDDFGLDLSFLVMAMVLENDNSNSTFFGHLTGRQAIMGHSMGGGSSWLASASNGEIETVVGLAPAETNPSAISDALDVDVPVLVISGASDGVTPPEDHHIPIYENSASECKALVSIAEGGHCGYADDGTLCDLGEFLFDGMSREEQQEITHTLLLYWLGYYLKNQEDANDAFEAYCYASDVLTLTTNCDISEVSQTAIDHEHPIFPNPAQESVFLWNEERRVVVADITGRVVWKEQNERPGYFSIDVSDWARGVYWVSAPGFRAMPLMLH